MRPIILLAITVLASIISTKTLAWTISADFDSGKLGTQADNGVDGFDGAGGNSIYTNEQTLRGGQAAKLTIEEGKTGYGTWGGEFTFPSKPGRGDKIWYQFHMYVPQDFDHYSYGEGGRLKVMRIQTKSSSGSNHGYLDLLIDQKGTENPFKWIYEGENVWRDIGEPKDMIVKERWESYQMAATLDTVPVDSGGQAEVRIYKNGKLLRHITDRRTLVDNTDNATRALLFTYWNGGAPKTQSLYVDEITITTETPSYRGADGYPQIPNALGDLGSPPSSIESIIVE